MTSLKKIIRKGYKKAKNILGSKNANKKNVIQFKKNIWQTDEISKSFVEGSNGNLLAAASIMDKEVNDFFLSHCKKNDKVLDIGCGHGIVSLFLAENGMQVTAIDISENLLSELKTQTLARNLSIEIKKGDAYSIESPSNNFDSVVARMFLPHFPDWPIVLKEMVRVTKTGGKLLVHFASKENSDAGKRLAIAECIFASSTDISNPWTFYAESDNAEINKVAKSNNLEVVNRTPLSFFLHNRIIGNQLGTELYNKYMIDVQNYMENEKVKEFILWFDQQIVSKCSPAISHFNIITFKKL